MCTACTVFVSVHSFRSLIFVNLVSKVMINIFFMVVQSAEKQKLQQAIGEHFTSNTTSIFHDGCIKFDCKKKFSCVEHSDTMTLNVKTNLKYW